MGTQMLAVFLNLVSTHPEPYTILPCLHTLIFDKVALSTTLSQKLQSFISARKDTIRRIDMYRCYVGEDHLTSLRNLVEVIHHQEQLGHIRLQGMLLGADLHGLPAGPYIDLASTQASTQEDDSPVSDELTDPFVGEDVQDIL